MLHFACLCPAVPGHLNPTTAVAKALLSRGHRVTLVGIVDALPAANAANLAFQPVGEAEFPRGSVAELSSHLGTLKGWRALKLTVDHLARSEQVILRDLPAVIAGCGVDALVVDQLHAGASTVADYLNVPFVTLCNALMTNREPLIPPFPTTWSYRDSWWERTRNRAGWAVVDSLLRPVGKICNAQRRSWGLPLYEAPDDAYSTLAQISQQPQGFDFPRLRLPQHFHYVGPLTDETARKPVDFPFERLDGKPLLYASMGTLQNQLQGAFRVIIDACEGLPVQLVLSLGSSDSKIKSKLPAWPLIVDYAPQLQLLARAALTITHAGLNTTLESLRSGVPMVAIPVTNDQPGVAARIAYTGVGEMVPLRKLETQRLRRAIERVLETPSYREKAQSYAETIAESPGPPRAAEIIERAVSTGKPVLPQTMMPLSSPMRPA